MSKFRTYSIAQNVVCAPWQVPTYDSTLQFRIFNPWQKSKFILHSVLWSYLVSDSQVASPNRISESNDTSYCDLHFNEGVFGGLPICSTVDNIVGAPVLTNGYDGFIFKQGQYFFEDIWFSEGVVFFTHIVNYNPLIIHFFNSVVVTIKELISEE
jgi:hypothetical protein